ncbi:hypothetical protein FB99_43980 (plasmid) [Pantoea agglomerans]|nr:hypothetical protein FB99_43980 [Pantoea agglomerans]
MPWFNSFHAMLPDSVTLVRSINIDANLICFFSAMLEN